MSETATTPNEQPVAAAAVAASEAPETVPSSGRPAVEEPTEPTNRLYIGNLAPSVKVPYLRELTASYGKLPIVLRAGAGRRARARKFAFITFPTPEECTKARSELMGKVLKEGQEPIKVAYAAELNNQNGESKPAENSAKRTPRAPKEKAAPKAAPKPRAARVKLPDSDDSVFVKGLEKGTTAEDIGKLFEKYNNPAVTIIVRPAKREVVRARRTFPARAESTIAFVKVGKDFQAAAIAELHGTEFNQHTLIVSKATMSYEQAVAEGKIEPRAAETETKTETSAETETQTETETSAETEAEPKAEVTA